MTDERLRECAVNALLAALASVPRGTIPATAWWERGRSALETAADRAADWPQFCATLAAKLGIRVFTERSADSLLRTGREIAVDDSFTRFREICGPAEAVYVVAEAQIENKARRGPRHG